MTKTKTGRRYQKSTLKTRLEHGPSVIREAEPGCVPDYAEVVVAQGDGNHEADGDANGENPHAEKGRALEGDDDADDQGDYSGQHEQQGGGFIRQYDGAAYDVGHGGDGDEHDDDAADGGGEDSPEGGESNGQEELDEGGGDHEAGEEARPAGLEGEGANGEEGDVEVRDDEAARAEVAEPEGIENHGGAGDGEGGEDDPIQIGVGLAGGAHDEGRQHNEADGVGEEYLQSGSSRRCRRALLIGFVAKLSHLSH